ncbi:molybdate ABC transporter permease subunit [Microaerobacter geothermalis]|uniref:molybdate ABC transporter permease subunit n=1 Tax=Microaerobacter geothermalis TaxID=674972 RepID=UPI001F471F89|nr:molybdate ABC transporter permease subunit [Microaerobacter geothermalis]MCF6093013.1 molybdate ABC transporter permease subunit [Microaerobacter geothermalis]
MEMIPLYLSVKIASIATSFVFITAVFIARIMVHRSFPGKMVLESTFMLPLVLPPTVVGFGLLFLFGKNGWLGKWLWEWFGIQLVFTWWAAVIASIVVSFPLMYQSAVAAFKTVDTNLENAARTMGSSEWKVFWTITFPLGWPGLLAGLVLTFARALGEFGATLMFAGFIPGKTETIPLAIYFAVERGSTALAMYWVMIIISMGFAAMMWLNWWSKRNMDRHRIEG